jgi:hypothetical protein
MDRLQELLGRIQELSDEELFELRDIITTQFDAMQPTPPPFTVRPLSNSWSPSPPPQRRSTVSGSAATRTSRATTTPDRSSPRSARMAATPPFRRIAGRAT